MTANFKMINRENNMNYPDAKLHQIISFVKSGIRIVGCVFLPINLLTGAVLLAIAEGLGIVEELV